MNNGHEEPAIRILSGGGDKPQPMEPIEPRPFRWWVPAAVLAGAIGLLLLLPGFNSEDSESVTTQAASMAAVNAEELDFRIQRPAITTGDWSKVDIDESGHVYDMIRGRSVYVAVGSTLEGAQVWTSSTGTRWSPISNVERPGGKSSIDHVAQGGTRLVGLGSVDDTIGIWTAPIATSWVYAGPLDNSTTGSAVGLAAADEILAMISTDSGYAAWTSDTGLEWEPIGPLQGLENAEVRGLTATNDTFFAYGLESGCAMIYSSTDGAIWQPTFDPVPECGAILDLIVAGRELIALGWLIDSSDRTEVAIWKSTDGAAWQRVAADEPLLAAADANIEVIEVQSDPAIGSTALVEVNDVPAWVTTGTVLQTNAGSFTISAIANDAISLQQGGTSVRLNTERTARFQSVLQPMRIAVEGDRIVVVGNITAQAYWSSTPVVWASADGGDTWTMDTLPGVAAANYEIATRATAVTALGIGSQTVTGWRAAWDTTPAADQARYLAQAYLSAIATYNPDGVIAAVPQTVSNAGIVNYQVPSLGRQNPGWWDADGVLDTDRVEDTMQYLAAMDTSLVTEDCRVGITLGLADRATVACDITVDSDLMGLYGITHGEGQFQAEVRDGLLVSALVNPAPEAGMWSSLTPFLLTLDSDLQLEFDEESAVTHLANAHAYIESLLRPGETKVVDTVLGSVEWSWVDELDFAALSWIDSAVWTDFGFMTLGYMRTGRTSLFTSVDGFNWEETPLPEDVDGLWDIHPFGDGVIGSIWNEFSAGLVYYDGSDWTVIDLPREGERVDYFATAAGVDSALVAAFTWDDGSESTSLELYLVNTDLSFKTLDTPEEWMADDPGWWFGGAELVASANGFLATIYDYATGGVAIWGTPDGEEWTLLTERLTLNDSPGFWNLQVHRDRYFVVGEGAELICYDTEFGEECGTLSQMWTSEDGTRWQELRTTTGDVVATNEIGSGPLGLVAFGSPVSDQQTTRSMYVSADGSTWEQVPGISLLNPGGQMWWWTSRPAVGVDAVVATGSTYRESDGQERPFMIVGRLIDE